ncbi:MAG: plasmid mobilization relaxosome protein MobC [Oscillospiraceae bacterium]|nr:plasmid mobilization relaxosome protein MobC [Oscillospiraceae bacterium]
MQANRTRNKPIQVYFTESEIQHIRVKMERALTKNMSAYVRKMATDGLILNLNFDSLDRLFSDVGKASRLINQIVKRVNSTGRFYAEDIVEIQEKQPEIL